MVVAGSLVLAAVYLLFADGILAMFGGTVNEETFGLAKEYFSISASAYRFICSDRH